MGEDREFDEMMELENNESETEVVDSYDDDEVTDIVPCEEDGTGSVAALVGFGVACAAGGVLLWNKAICPAAKWVKNKVTTWNEDRKAKKAAKNNPQPAATDDGNGSDDDDDTTNEN